MVYFSDGKNKPAKRTEQFISSIKNLRKTFYVTCYHCSRSTSLDSFVYDSFVKKATQKNYIALAKTCVKKDVFICVSELLNACVRIGD